MNQISSFLVSLKYLTIRNIQATEIDGFTAWGDRPGRSGYFQAAIRLDLATLRLGDYDHDCEHKK
jgi:hypothetical protein